MNEEFEADIMWFNQRKKPIGKKYFKDIYDDDFEKAMDYTHSGKRELIF